MAKLKRVSLPPSSLGVQYLQMAMMKLASSNHSIQKLIFLEKVTIQWLERSFIGDISVLLRHDRAFLLFVVGWQIIREHIEFSIAPLVTTIKTCML